MEGSTTPQEFSGILLATSGPYTERMFQTGPSGGLIGRSRKCKISLLHDCEVSHNHAIIELQRGALCIRDVGSTFGTYLNDKRLSEPKRASESHKLKPCDSIKVGQTSLRWWPISSIRCAASVTIPHVLAPANEYLSRVPAALLPADDHHELSRVLHLQHVQNEHVWAAICRSVTPVDLPQLMRRLGQMLHVQVHTARHGYSLRRQLGTSNSVGYNSGAEVVASLAAAVATLGLQGLRDDVLPTVEFDSAELASGISQLRELLREAAGLGQEIGNMHSEQLERIATLIKEQRDYATELKHSPLRTPLTRMWQLLTPLESANLPVLGELQRWLEQGSAACDFALEQALLAETWLVRVGQSMRCAQSVSARLPELLRTKRNILAQLRMRTWEARNSAQQTNATAFPRASVGVRQQEVVAEAHARDRLVERTAERNIGVKAKRADSVATGRMHTLDGEEMSDDAEQVEEASDEWMGQDGEELGDEQQEEVVRWEARSAILRTLQQLRDQDTELLWILRNGGAEVQLQMMVEFAALVAPEPDCGLRPESGLEVIDKLCSETAGPHLLELSLRSSSLSESTDAMAVDRLATPEAVAEARAGGEPSWPLESELAVTPRDRLRAALESLDASSDGHSDGVACFPPLRDGWKGAAPTLACYSWDARALALLDQAAAPSVALRGVPVLLKGSPCEVHVLTPKNVRTLLLALRSLQHRQEAGCGCATRIVRIDHCWLERKLIRGEACRLVTFHTDQRERLSHALLSQLNARTRRRIARDVCAAVVAMHDVNLSCGGDITLSDVALSATPTIDDFRLSFPPAREAFLCCVGAPLGDMCAPLRASAPDAWASLPPPPEAAASGVQPPRAAVTADIWALGTLIWRICCADSTEEPPPQLPANGHGLLELAGADDDMRTLLASMFSPHPAQRPSATEVLMHPALNVGVSFGFAGGSTLRSPANRTGVEVVWQMRRLHSELFNIRRASADRPSVRWTVDATPRRVARRMLALTAELSADEIFCNIEVEMINGSGEGDADVGQGEAHAVSLSEALRLFWRDALREDLHPPILHVRARRTIMGSDTAPGLPTDAPLPPTDVSIADCLPESTREQAALGTLLLISLANGVPLPSWLPPSYFRILLGRASAVTLTDLQAARPRMACRCAMMLSSIGSELEWDDLEEPSSLLPPELNDLAEVAMPTPAGSQSSLSGFGAAHSSSTSTPNVKLTLVDSALRWQLLGARQQAASALESGFRAPQPAPLSELLSHISCEALMLAGCGGFELSAAALESCIEFDGFEAHSQTPALLRTLLRDFDGLQRRLFVLLVTGRVAPAAPPPVSAMRIESWEGIIVVRHWPNSVDLPPQPLRASWDLLLPNYNDAELLRHMLAKAMSRFARRP